MRSERLHVMERLGARKGVVLAIASAFVTPDTLTR